jgi:hypothetical protein
MRRGFVSQVALVLASLQFDPLRRYPTPNADEINEDDESRHDNQEHRQHHCSPLP